MNQDALSLRHVEPADLDAFFAQQRDTIARHMAAFTSKDGAYRAAFDAHWARILARSPMRTLHARAAAHNAGSIRLLTRCGFVACDTDRGLGGVRGEEVDEVLFRLG